MQKNIFSYEKSYFPTKFRSRLRKHIVIKRVNGCIDVSTRMRGISHVKIVQMKLMSMNSRYRIIKRQNGKRAREIFLEEKPKT